MDKQEIADAIGEDNAFRFINEAVHELRKLTGSMKLVEADIEKLDMTPAEPEGSNNVKLTAFAAGHQWSDVFPRQTDPVTGESLNQQKMDRLRDTGFVDAATGQQVVAPVDTGFVDPMDKPATPPTDAPAADHSADKLLETE